MVSPVRVFVILFGFSSNLLIAQSQTSTTTPYPTTTTRATTTTTYPTTTRGYTTTTYPTTTTRGYTTTTYPTTTYRPPAPYCNADFWYYDGSFNSPYYPFNYPDNANCTWRITVNLGCQIRVDFWQGFHTEPHPECRYDYLEFRDGPYEYSPLITRMCGYIANPNAVYSSSNQLFVRFVSDAVETGSGFQAYFFTVCAPTITTTRAPPPTTASPSPITTASPPAVGGSGGIVINNNNNMFVNFFDWSKLQSWMSDLKSQFGNLRGGPQEELKI